MEVWPSFCANCGQRVDRQDKFCRNCGVAVPQQPFESAGTMARPAFREDAAPVTTPPPQVVPPPAKELPQVDVRRQSVEPPPPQEFASPAEPPLRSQEPDLREAPAPVPTAFDYLAPTPIPTAYDYVAQEEEVVEKPPRRRKSRLPVLEILVIVLLLVGAGAAVWMLRSSLPPKHAAVPSNVDILLAPTTARVAAGHAVDFSATVTGTDNVEVDWSVQEGDAGGRVVPRGAKADGGTVSTLAVYIAPDTPGTYHLLATSKADPQKSASAEITVKAGKSR